MIDFIIKTMKDCDFRYHNLSILESASRKIPHDMRNDLYVMQIKVLVEFADCHNVQTLLDALDSKVDVTTKLELRFMHIKLSDVEINNDDMKHLLRLSYAIDLIV